MRAILAAAVIALAACSHEAAVVEVTPVECTALFCGKINNVSTFYGIAADGDCECACPSDVVAYATDGGRLVVYSAFVSFHVEQWPPTPGFLDEQNLRWQALCAGVKF